MGPARLNLDAGGGSGSGGGNNRGGSTVAPGAGALGLDNDDAGHRGCTINEWKSLGVLIYIRKWCTACIEKTAGRI